jgi:hypothetical protein
MLGLVLRAIFVPSLFDIEYFLACADKNLNPKINENLPALVDEWKKLSRP